jgi:serine/threonine-protein kinase TTK/MPS1
VYRVLDEKNNLFAIKRVDISKNDLESRNSFINEIHLLEKLRGHVEIIRLVDSEINESKKVLLMVSPRLSLCPTGILMDVSRSWRSERRI